ncbi:MAG: UrcA family protein [Caulobacteraceae bacterium]|nr:UrcA family protein [Caulobacteraceae bacterium]
MKAFLIAALGAACVAGAASANEAQLADKTVVHVGYDASSVATPRAAENLLGRLSQAAMQACGAFPGSVRDYKMTVMRSGCYQQKLDEAVAQVDSPVLSQVYQAEGSMLPASGG